MVSKKETSRKKIVKELLEKGQVELKGCYSEKTGKKYDAIVILDFDGIYANF